MTPRRRGRGVRVRSTSSRRRDLGAARPVGRAMVAAGFLEVLGWEQLTAAEQTAALVGACLGLAAWLVGRVVFGGRRRR